MMTFAPDEIRLLIGRKRWNELKARLARFEPADLASIMSQCAPGDQVLLYRALPPDLAADTFGFLEDDQQKALLKQFNEQETRTLLAELSPDDRTELFEEMPPGTVRRLMELLSSEDRREALMLLGYPEGSVGRLMSPDFATVRPEWTVREAIHHLRAHASESETLNVLYVVDPDGTLLDEIRLRRLVVAAPDVKISDLMNHQCTALSAFDHEDEAVRLMKQTGYYSLPVTDSARRLLGIVTADDVLDVAVEGATDDFHKGGGVQPLETHVLKASFGAMYGRRVGWLVVLVFINIFTGAGIARHAELIESVVALVFFLPLLVDSGGNAGSQAATIIIRAMALGEVTLADYGKVLWRELRVSLGLGVTMAAAVFVVARWRAGPDVAQVVGISMTCVVALGSLIGMSLPFVLQRMKLDPAAACAPLVTSLADIIGVLTYLGIASALLGAA
ncbi:MAG: magnesium transporter [Verrucomicrobiae bacterium]|nr:magnesium transporter [Verrucomicrobiae bacterium]